MTSGDLACDKFVTNCGQTCRRPDTHWDMRDWLAASRKQVTGLRQVWLLGFGVLNHKEYWETNWYKFTRKNVTENPHCMQIKLIRKRRTEKNSTQHGRHDANGLQKNSIQSEESDHKQNYKNRQTSPPSLTYDVGTILMKYWNIIESGNATENRHKLCTVHYKNIIFANSLKQNKNLKKWNYRELRMQ